MTNSPTIASRSRATFLPILALLLGIVLRLIQYLANRSIWIDESLLALNILSRNFGQLFLPLNYDQFSPIGFLLSEKAAVTLFGRSEYALRLVPLLTGIGLLFVFYPLALSFTSKFAAIAGTFLLAIAHFLIYYSSEVKQYSSDAFIAAAIVFLCVWLLKRERIDLRTAVFFGLANAVLIWFAHPAIFVVGGVLLTLGVKYLVEKDNSFLIKLGIIATLTIASFILFYFVSLRVISVNAGLAAFFDEKFSAFINFPPRSTADVQQYVTVLLRMFSRTVNVGDRIPQLAGVAACLSVIGAISIFLRDRYKAVLLIGPIGLTLVAAALHRYPFADRLILFLTPILAILVIEGLDFLRVQIREHARLMVAVLLLFVLWEPATRATTLVTYHQEAKPVFAYIQNHILDSDVIYLNNLSQYVFTYYMEQYHLQDKKHIFGKLLLSAPEMRSELRALRGNSRVWIVISNLDTSVFQPSMLDEFGKKLDTFSSIEFYVYLYDMNTTPATF